MQTLNDVRFEFRGKELVPIVQGGMGVNISTAALALEVARLGGIGHVSDAMSPFLNDRAFGTRYQNTKLKTFESSRDVVPKPEVKWAGDAVYEANRRYAEDTMGKKKGSGLVFMNVMEKLTMGSPQETLRARLRGAFDGGIDGVTLSAGLHTGTLKLIEDHPRFRDVAIGIIVSSPRALKIFLSYAKRVDRLPDFVVVEGPLAGGHLGFGMDWKEHDLRTIFHEVLAMLKEQELSIPVIPAGGIFTGADALSYVQEGAGAVQVATRFTITKECGLPEKVKQIYLSSKESDVEVNLSSPTGYPMRMLKSSPSLRSNVHPNCEALGYVLDRDGNCAYHQAYDAGACDESGKKLPISEKMCICFHFMNYNCYTCGHYVFRLKDTTELLPDGTYRLPKAEDVFKDYVNGTRHIVREVVKESDVLQSVSAGS